MALALRNGGVQGGQVTRGSQAQFLLPQSSVWACRLGVGPLGGSGRDFQDADPNIFPALPEPVLGLQEAYTWQPPSPWCSWFLFPLWEQNVNHTRDESLEPSRQIMARRTRRARSRSPPCEVEAEDPGLTLRCSDRRLCIRIRVSRLLSQPADAHGSGCMRKQAPDCFLIPSYSVNPKGPRPVCTHRTWLSPSCPLSVQPSQGLRCVCVHRPGQCHLLPNPARPHLAPPGPDRTSSAPGGWPSARRHICF